MTHDDVRARLSALIDGALNVRESREVEAHVAVCAACAARLDTLRSMVGILREDEPVSAPDGFAAAVRLRLERQEVGRSASIVSRALSRLPRIELSWRTAGAAAAVAVVGLFALNVLRDQQGQEGAFRQPIGAEQRSDSADSPAATSSRPAQEQTAAPRESLPAAPAPQGAPTIKAQSAPGRAASRLPSQYLVRTGRVAVEVEVFDAASRQIDEIADATGGIVASRSVGEEGGVSRGTFVVRVPAERFADAARRIEAVGRVRTREYQTRDVGEEFVDVEARLRNLERQEARLLSFMDRASRVPDLIAIEGELSRVRGEIEQLTGRRRYLANRIDLSTIEVEVTQKPAKKPGGFWDLDRTIARLQDAFLSTVRQILGALEGLAAIVAALAPLAILAAVGWILLRLLVRRPSSL
jgi:hypothetical protein